MWNALLATVFPATYKLSTFKARVNRLFLVKQVEFLGGAEGQESHPDSGLVKSLDQERRVAQKARNRTPTVDS
ncbi:jg1353 [Pararge aegeria aegeria]|uniref:Jg1353 protein n=1 Tax=Pararge aegeria aegeria TaxID=348720 RepID=A0A8S4S5L3_9NEOP|nr:jg1353 [Pararge aegeria aegeria]